MLMLVSSSVGLSCASVSAKTTQLTAEKSIIVDCLLPGKVRQLGINRTYVSRKRPAKTSANDCEIKGGDYVKYDRATLATSLSVWQQSASQGDAKAQYFVGEIFEKGKGQEPDYEMAVLWYQRAVKQDYQPAMMSLGRLYELGLGVEKDLVKAMNLYRQASGLEADEIAYASVFERIKEQDELRIAELKVALAQQTRKAKSIERQSQVLRSDLERVRGTVKNLKKEVIDLRQKLKSADQASKPQLQKDLARKEAYLADEAQRQGNLLQKLNDAETRLKAANAKINELEPSGAPEVVIKWPATSAGEQGLVSDVPVGSIINVVGAVTAFTKVQGITINGDEYQLDANGLFLKSIDVGRDPVVLNIQVQHSDGQIVTQVLDIRPSSDINLAIAGAGALTKTKFDFGNYHALVIGNNDYDYNKGWEPLDTAVNDAKAVAKVLEEDYGFNVRLELNANRDTILTALEETRRNLTGDDNLLVYYAGHGLVDPENDQGYWVPVDGSTDSAVRWVSNASITDQIRAMTARNIMVIADSCYSGSLMRSGMVTLRSGLTPEKKALRLRDDVKQMTRVALSSGGLQPVIDSVENSQHSVFANALLSVLKSNAELLDADSLATQVAHSVAIATKDNVRQVPRYAPLAAGGHEGGEFYFRPTETQKN